MSAIIRSRDNVGKGLIREGIADHEDMILAAAADAAAELAAIEAEAEAWCPARFGSEAYWAWWDGTDLLERARRRAEGPRYAVNDFSDAEDAFALYWDLYKEINGIRPRHLRTEQRTLEGWVEALNDLYRWG